MLSRALTLLTTNKLQVRPPGAAEYKHNSKDFFRSMYYTLKHGLVTTDRQQGKSLPNI